MQADNLLFWVDLEMTGLNVEIDTILEIACVITNNNLEIIAQGPHIIIHQPDAVLSTMDDWNQKQHAQSGLIEDVRQSKVSMLEAYEKVFDFVREYCKQQTAPLCGNTIYQDRIFLKKYMPELEQYFHYRVIDVSTVKELVRRWYPKDPCSYYKKEEFSTHRAVEDIRGSIEELKHYQNYFFRQI